MPQSSAQEVHHVYGGHKANQPLCARISDGKPREAIEGHGLYGSHDGSSGRNCDHIRRGYTHYIARPLGVSGVKNTTQIRLGGEYLIIKPDQNWVVPLRWGIFYDPEPSEGDVKDFYGISIGTGISYKRYVFDLAYQLRWARHVDTSNLIGASEANIMQHLLMFSFILHF